MKEVNHSQRKQKPKFLLPLVLIVTLILIALACFLLIRSGKQPSPPIPVEAADTDNVLFSCNSEQLFSVMITPRGQEPYTLAWHDGIFSLEGDENFPLRQALLSDLSVYATYIEPLDKLIDLSESVTDPDGHTLSRADFGLQPAAYSVLIRATDGNSITLYFGDYFEDGAFIRYYMATDHDDIIYIVSSDLYDSFAYNRNMLHTVEKPAVDSSLFDAVSVTGEKDLALTRIGDYWYVTKQSPYPANEEIVLNFLERADNLRFSSWVGAADELDLSEFGLEEPRFSVSFHYADTLVEGYDEHDQFVSAVVPGKTQTFLIGKDASATENISFYCLYEGHVYIGTYFTFGFLMFITPEDLYLRNPVSYASNAIEQVSFTDKAGTATYDIELIESILQNGQLETDPETGEQIYTLSVRRDQDPVDTETFLVWYNRLTQLSASGLLPDSYVPEGETLYTITLRFNNNTRVIRFYQYDTLHLAISVDGTCLFYLPASLIENLPPLP